MDKFERVALNLERTMALANLLTECEKQNVRVKEVASYLNGFQVLFANIKGDVILHDGSSGKNCCLWESAGFPWDGDEISVHDAETLVRLVGALQRGEDWEKVEA